MKKLLITLLAISYLPLSTAASKVTLGEVLQDSKVATQHCFQIEDRLSCFTKYQDRYLATDQSYDDIQMLFIVGGLSHIDLELVTYSEFSQISTEIAYTFFFTPSDEKTRWECAGETAAAAIVGAGKGAAAVGGGIAVASGGAAGPAVGAAAGGYLDGKKAYEDCKEREYAD